MTKGTGLEALQAIEGYVPGMRQRLELALSARQISAIRWASSLLALQEASDVYAPQLTHS